MYPSIKHSGHRVNADNSSKASVAVFWILFAWLLLLVFFTSNYSKREIIKRHRHLLISSINENYSEHIIKNAIILLIFKRGNCIVENLRPAIRN